MKLGAILFTVIVLTVLFGAVPLIVTGEIFAFIGNLLKQLGKALDFFGWGGVLAIQNLNMGGIWNTI